MINLEWLKTFKSVYKTQNYSRAAEELFITQPAVSNQIKMLEATVGHKLFIRKSKGVKPTENAIFLNNLIIDALDVLETVENHYSTKLNKKDKLYVLGFSKHMYNSLINKQIFELFKHLSIQFIEDNKTLFELVNTQQIDAAIVRENIETFDILSHKIFSTPLVVVGNTELDTSTLETYITNNQLSDIRYWMEQQIWFSHSSTNPFIKKFWLHCFNKKRPKVFTNFIIPNEYLMLKQLTNTIGIAVTVLENANEFIANKTLKVIWQPDTYPNRNYYLIAHKKQKPFFELMKTYFTDTF